MGVETGRLRSGWTTGTCAAAAAAAAAAFCMGREAAWGEARLPSGEAVRFPAKPVPFEGQIWHAVRKDAGDDPDVTDGVRVLARVERLAADAAVSPLWYGTDGCPGLYLTGGTGIGVVTRRGLACPEGRHAINPVPRAMIFQAAERALREAGARPGNEAFLIRLSIPEGAALAARTFNPRLGIEGGISVLGTSGIVKPMSEEALLDTIRLEIHMKAAEGRRRLILTPGNYGEQFLKELGLPEDAAVLCSNFIRDAAVCAAEERFERILLAGHIGKLIKIAGGVPNTHSRYGDRRMEILADCLRACAGKRRQEALALAEGLVSCVTTEEALERLEQAGFRNAVMAEAVRRMREVLRRWTGAEKSGGPEMEVVTFSSVYGILGSSMDAEALKAWMREG